jgi:hypothetical protein
VHIDLHGTVSLVLQRAASRRLLYLAVGLFAREYELKQDAD